jgi:hypothetical protein
LKGAIMNINKVIIGIIAAAAMLASGATGAFITWGVAGDSGPAPIVVATLTTVDVPVCHAATEDSLLRDCEYRAGGWYQR